jgi:hypothetical protein
MIATWTEHLRRKPEIAALANDYLRGRATSALTTEPVTIPGDIFHALCLAACAGLEAVAESRGGE